MPAIVIRGSYMGGYGLPALLAFVTVFAGLAGVVSRIWSRPSALIGWLILYSFSVGTVFVIEAVSRRNVLEVSDERIRWSLRQPRDKGDQPLSSLRTVEVDSIQLRLVFGERAVIANRVLFRRRDISRFVARLQQLGARVSEQPGIQ